MTNYNENEIETKHVSLLFSTQGDQIMCMT